MTCKNCKVLNNLNLLKSLNDPLMTFDPNYLNQYKVFLQSTFSNRELSLLIWLLLIILIVLIIKKARIAITPLLKAFFQKNLFKAYVFLIIYQSILIFSFISTKLWSTKDYLFWLFTVAFVLFFNYSKTKEISFYRESIKGSIKFTVLVQFIINFYSLSLISELILFPTSALYAFLLAFYGSKEKYNEAYKFLNIILSIIVFSYLIISCYWTFIGLDNFYSIKTLYVFLFPLVLTIAYLPFLYLNTLFWEYITLFKKLESPCKSKKEYKTVKKNVIYIVRFNLKKLNLISQNYNSYSFRKSENKKKYLKNICQI